MELRLIRDTFTKRTTTGKLLVDEEFECYTLEDTMRDPGVKIYGKTAIPPGRYRVVLAWSPKRGRKVPYLLNVPNFTAIQIHVGNTEDDTEGCILVGKYRILNKTLMSRVAYNALYEKIELAQNMGEKIWITVTGGEEEDDGDTYQGVQEGDVHGGSEAGGT